MKTCLGLMNGDSEYCRIIRQILALFFIAHVDATEIYVGRGQKSDTIFNYYCKNMENLVIL